MDLQLRIEQVADKHIEPYRRLSAVELGDTAAVSQANHLRWKFIENPQGPSVGIHLYRNDELIGRMVALTRQFLHRGKIYRAAHIVDFLVHPKERGMASLLQLGRGLKQISGFDFFLILAPNAAGAEVWEKFVKMRGYFDLDVAVAPLRPASLLESAGKFRSSPFARALDRPWQFFWGTISRMRGSIGNIEIDTEWPPQKELDELQASNSGEQIVGLRSGEYLEWRYKKSPVFRYSALFLRNAGKLSGYLVTRRHVYDGIDCLFVVDAFGRPEVAPSYWGAALRLCAAQLFRDGAEMAMIFGNTEIGPISSLKRLPFLTVPPRFLPRKTKLYAQWITSPEFEIRRENFYVALGDSDVI
jgi:hypothetical protein